MSWDLSHVASDVFASSRKSGDLQPSKFTTDVGLEALSVESDWMHWEGCDVAVDVFARYLRPDTTSQRHKRGEKLRQRRLLRKPKELKSLAILLPCQRLHELASKELLQATAWIFDAPYYIQRFALEMRNLNHHHLVHKLHFIIFLGWCRGAPTGDAWLQFFGMRYLLPTKGGSRRWISLLNMLFPNVQHLQLETYDGLDGAEEPIIELDLLRDVWIEQVTVPRVMVHLYPQTWFFNDCNEATVQHTIEKELESRPLIWDLDGV